MPGTIFTPQVEVQINGSTVGGVTGARVESSFADPVSRGYAHFRQAPGWGHGDELRISMGNGTNFALRFTGTILQGDYMNTGPSVSIIGRGPLYRLQKYRNNEPKGLGLIELTGGPATDEAIVSAVLDSAGIGHGSIGGTGVVRGTSAPDGYRWAFGETALEYIQRIDKASLGFRMVESIGGEMFRTQVFGRPRGGSDYTFTEGIDIFEGTHTQRSTFERYQAVAVTGFDYGDGLGPVSFSIPSGLSQGQQAYAFHSNLIESIDGSDPRGGISAEAVANYLLEETDREVVKVSGLSTPSDVLVGPGQTHSVIVPLAGVTEPLWVLGVSIEVDEDNFTQTFEYIGGGQADGGYEGP
jgi:hypothetical protein